MKPLVVFLLPLDWVLVSPTIHTPSSIYTPGRREALREYIKEQHLTMFSARDGTQTARSGVERTNHEAHGVSQAVSIP